ncbi:MAG: hypothetical protein ABMA64_15775 [Myxococcota bacterium]
MVISPVSRSTSRTTSLPVSATTSRRPASTSRFPGSRSAFAGAFSSASVAGPPSPAYPATPGTPAIVSMVPSGSIRRTTWFIRSATNIAPSASNPSDAGRSNSASDAGPPSPENHSVPTPYG